MKADNATTIKRVNEIYTMICQGANTINIMQYAASNWKIKNRATYNLITKARTYLKKRVDKSMEFERMEAIIRYDDLYRQLYKEQRYLDAANVQSKKDKITGIDIKKIETLNTNIDIDIEDEENIKEKIDSLLEMRSLYYDKQ